MNNPDQETVQNVSKDYSVLCYRLFLKIFQTLFIYQRKHYQINNQIIDKLTLKTYSIKQELNSQIGEIKQLKNRLASANKFVPINILQKSILIPQGHANPYKIPLPKPGILSANLPDDQKQNKTKKKKIIK